VFVISRDVDEKFWETLRELWLSYLNDHLEELAKNQKRFTKRFLKLLKEKGYVLTPELIREISNWIDHAQREIQNLIQFLVLIVARATSMRDEEAAKIASEIFEHRWEDGLNLSERIWNFKQEQVRIIGEVLRDGIYRGAGAKKLAYELQYALENVPFENFQKDWLPQWLDRILEQLKPLAKDPKGVEKLKALRDKIERKVKRYARSIRNYARTKKLIEDISKAIEKGSYELIDRAVEFYLYDRQLQRLERIARTESAYAYTETLKRYSRKLKYLKGFKWVLSKRHKARDICDVYAHADFGLGKGIFPPDKVPRVPVHPNCLCHIVPVVKREIEEEVKEFPLPRVPKEVVKLSAPKYIQHLDILGLPWEHLFDWENGKWKLRRKDVDALIGQENRELLEKIAKPVAENKWQMVEGKKLRKELEKLEKVIPNEVFATLKRKRRVSSLTLHFLKRKYVDGMEFKNEEDYMAWIRKQLKNFDNLIFRQGEDLVVYNPETRVVIAIAGGRGFILTGHLLLEGTHYLDRAIPATEHLGILREYLQPILDFLGGFLSTTPH